METAYKIGFMVSLFLVVLSFTEIENKWCRLIEKIGVVLFMMTYVFMEVVAE